MTHPLIAEIEAATQGFQERAKTAVHAEFKKFFEAHPEVGSVNWTQFTPHFNDGEACVFGINEFCFGEFDAEEPACDEEGDILCRIDRETNGYTDYSNGAADYPEMPAIRKETLEDRKLISDADVLEHLCVGLNTYMEYIFGDHCRVVATRSGFDVQEYEHD